MLPYKNHSDKLQQIINVELSLGENVAYFLQRIAANSHLNAFNQVFAEEATTLSTRRYDVCSRIDPDFGATLCCLCAEDMSENGNEVKS